MKKYSNIFLPPLNSGQNVHYKHLSYLFTSDNLSASNSELDRTYERMNQLVTGNDDQHWKQYHPRTNVLWIQYIIGKILRSSTDDRPLFDESSTTAADHVIQLLTNYEKLGDNCNSASELFDKIIAIANRNNDDVCRIRFN